MKKVNRYSESCIFGYIEKFFVNPKESWVWLSFGQSESLDVQFNITAN